MLQCLKDLYWFILSKGEKESHLTQKKWYFYIIKYLSLSSRTLIFKVLGPVVEMVFQNLYTLQQAWAEADSFFCFVELLSGFRDHFCQKLDNSEVGIISTLNKFSQLLKLHDPEVWHHLEVKTEVCVPRNYFFIFLFSLYTHHMCGFIWVTEMN